MNKVGKIKINPPIVGVPSFLRWDSPTNTLIRCPTFNFFKAGINNNPKITAYDLSKQFNVTDRTIKRDLKVLTDEKTIEYIGSAKDGYWKVDNKGWWYRYPDGTYPKDEWAYIYSSNNYILHLKDET